jgi:hypothetical protein
MRPAFIVAFAATALLVGSAQSLQAQVCFGNPSRGGISYVNGKGYGTTKSNGGQLSYAPGRFAIVIGGRTIDASDDEDGFGAALRLGLVFGSKLRVCPTVGVGFDRLEWEPDASTKVTTSQLIARGGIGVGYDIVPVSKLGIAPFIIGEFVERGNYFKTEVSNSDATNSGDYKGKAEATLGIIAHFSRIFLGASASHKLEKGAADERLIYGGFAF